MDVNAIKSSPSNQTPASGDQADGATFSLGGSALSFLALMQNTKTRLAGNITQMMESKALSHPIEGAEPISRPAERASESGRDDGYDRSQERGIGAERAEDRVDAPGRDRDANDDGRPVADGGGEPDAQGTGDDSHQDARNDQNNGDHDQSADGGGADDASTTDQPNGESSQQNETASDSPSAAEGSAEPNGEAQTASADAGGAATLTGGQRAQELLSGLLATSEASALPGQAAEQAVERTGDTSGNRARQGLSTALNAVSTQASTQGSGANHQGAHDAGQRTPGQVQTALQTPIQAAAQAETAGSANTATQQQAAALSRTIGEGNRLSVQVDVTDKSATLISQPRSALTSTAVLGGEIGNQSQSNHSLSQGNAHAGLQGTLNPAAQQAAGPNQGQNQQAAGQATQAITGAATDAKGLVQAAGQANAAAQGGQATAGDASASAGPSGTTETGQSQQAKASQAANAQRSMAQGKAVAEQVSVQISKAIEAGIDRINIQLKPESMGRIDVKLDVGLDGRVAVVVTADNKDTLDLLERDQKSLEQALQDAGLDTDAGNMSFNLREKNPDGSDKPTAEAAPPEDEPAEAAQANLDDLIAAIEDGDFGADGRVDIRA